MARRRRMEFQQTGRSGRRGGVPESFDRIFISRRMLLARTAVVGGFTALASRLGYMQIIAHDAAVEDARGNREFTKSLLAPRGLIYDRQGRPLAKNETAFQVEIIPNELPSAKTAPAQRRQVLDRLIAELQLPDALVIDPNDIPKDQKDEVYATIAHRRGREDIDIAASVEAIKTAEKQNYLILLDDNLSIDDAAKWRLFCQSTPGARVMSLLDYQLGNTPPDSRNAVIVKTDVGREMAMSIEANKLDLPGVRIDDSVLVRRYPGGTSMSHILGFVGPVSQEEIDAGENRNDAGAPLYGNNDRIGKDGLEKALEKTLRGQKGHRVILRDAIGNEIGIAPGSEDFNREATAGDSVSLTVDLELQAAASRALKSFIEFSTDDRKAKGNDKNKQFSISGAVVAMDPRSGEVLAMVSYPQYDNALLAKGISVALWKDLNGDSSGKPYFNRAIGSAQPPGSTFKAFLAAAALHEGTLHPDDTFVCTGGLGLPVAGDLVHYNPHPCWWSRGHGALALDDALKTSCDVYFYNVGTGTVDDLYYIDLSYPNGSSEAVTGEEKKTFSGLGIDRIHKDMTGKFWFGDYTGFILGGEATGLIPSQDWLFETHNREGWNAGQTIITSIGQGFVQVTPLQMAVNTVALANGGTIYTPTLLRETITGVVTGEATPDTEDQSNSVVTPFDPLPPLRKLEFMPEHIDPVRNGMLHVVNDYIGPDQLLNGSTSAVELADGTFSPELAWPRTNPPGTAEADRILIAGKTGTAEVEPSDPDAPKKDENGKYYNQHAWFTCWAPYEKPEIVVSVLIEYGGEGGTYAAPCADVVLRAYFETTGRRKRDQMVDDRGKQRLVSVLSKDKEPVLDIETAESLAWFKPGDTYDTSGSRD